MQAYPIHVCFFGCSSEDTSQLSPPGQLLQSSQLKYESLEVLLGRLDGQRGFGGSTSPHKEWIEQG